MEQAETQVREDFAGEALILLGRCPGDDGGRLLDQRTDDERLASLGDARADEVVGLLALVRADPERLHGQAAGRHLVDYGDVQVAEEGEGERPRYGRRRHDEEVRREPLAVGGTLAQGGPLHDAEPVLLIDNGEPEAPEGDPLLDQGVGADGDVHLSGRYRLAQGAFRGAWPGAGEQLDAQGRAAAESDLPEERRQRSVVLLGQNLCRGHEDALVAVRGGDGERRTGDGRLAAAHVALKEAGHRPAGGGGGQG